MIKHKLNIAKTTNKNHTTKDRLYKMFMYKNDVSKSEIRGIILEVETDMVCFLIVSQQNCTECNGSHLRFQFRSQFCFDIYSLSIKQMDMHPYF